MENPYLLQLSLITFLPAIGALVLAFFPRDTKGAMRWFTLGITAVVFLLTVWLAIPRPEGADTPQFKLGVSAMQDVFSVPWIKSFNILNDTIRRRRQGNDCGAPGRTRTSTPLGTAF